MTKAAAKAAYQQRNNEIVENIMERMSAEFYTSGSRRCRRLRSCNAVVYTTDNFYVLKSYRTIIACIDRNTDTLYDFLRKVYGYTATSAQHIAKFASDYGSWGYGCRESYRWEYVRQQGN